MIPRAIVFPLSKFIKDIEDVKLWIEKFMVAFSKTYDSIANEFQDGEKIIIVGSDKKHIHGLVSRKQDFKL